MPKNYTVNRINPIRKKYDELTTTEKRKEEVIKALKHGRENAEKIAREHLQIIKKRIDKLT